MNLLDSSFLCLDIGTTCVRGMAHRVRNAHMDKSAIFSCDSRDTVFAIKSVVDELERQIGTHLDTAYVTGNLGAAQYGLSRQQDAWSGEHKISASDIQSQISKIPQIDGFYPMHIIPLQYASPGTLYKQSPIGYIANSLTSFFATIFYDRSRCDQITSALRRAHLMPESFYDPQFLHSNTIRRDEETILFIDLGAEYSSVSLWTHRGPMALTKIPVGGDKISQDIADKLSISFEDADRIKRAAASLLHQEMDRFTPADAEYDFSRADVSDIARPRMVDIVGQLKAAVANATAKYPPNRIVLTGGGAEMTGCSEFIENTFGLPVENRHGDATVRALSSYIWNGQAARRNAFQNRQARNQRRLQWIARLFNRKIRRPQKKLVPIMPSSLCFDMARPETYTLFDSGDISIIHVDIMDGFYVDRVASSIAELKSIRAQTESHLHVHLMTESPEIWAADAIAAGANTVIISTNTAGARAAIHTVRAARRRIGIALNPDSDVLILKDILREIDEVMVMSVAPGAAGQEFDERALRNIRILNATRRKFGLKLTISVDGGINPETAQKCWAAGADLLVSGSYLARATDFPLAVQSLLPHNTTK